MSGNSGDSRYILDSMIPKPLEQIEELDLQALVSNAVTEGRTIEYNGNSLGTQIVTGLSFLQICHRSQIHRVETSSLE